MSAHDANPLSPAAPSPADRTGQYVVVARRYRPRTFEELIGQEHVARALTGAIAANRVGHAYLFTGARGVGKTSAARILAKALNCQQGPTATPCNECDNCQGIAAGSDVDVLEIDGASNRGIDEIRQLRQNVSIRPSRARYKIYIIDEVHMLTREAFNALLKTLEEPPEHVKFIFCTTEATKIPITILSRCQRFDFAGIQLPSIIARLRQIVEAEGVTADDEALAMLARRAAGSMRDSQSLLEQLLGFGGRHITTADVHTMLGTAGDVRLTGLVGHLVARDARQAIADLDLALTEGVDVGQLLEQLLGYFRDCMTAAVGCPPDAFLHTAPAEYERLSAAGKELGLETVLAIMQILDHTLARLRYSTQSRTLAEMALVRIANLENLDALADLVAQVRSGVAVDLRETRPARPSIGSSAAVISDAAAKKKDESPLPVAEPNGALGGVNGPDSVEPRRAPEPIALSPASVDAIWRRALESLSDLAAENAALCESVTLTAPNRLVIAFRPKYTACRVFCERPDQLGKLQAALAEAAGGTIQIEFNTLKEEETAAAPRRAVPNRQRLAEKAEHPLVRRAAELFDARVVRVEEQDG